MTEFNFRLILDLLILNDGLAIICEFKCRVIQGYQF